MLKLFKDYIKTNKLFWKFRHLIDTNVWEEYYNSYSEKRREFYTEFIIQRTISSRKTATQTKTSQHWGLSC